MAKQQGEAARKETAYPYYSWQKCLQLVEAVERAGGARSDVSKDALAHAMKVSVAAASLAQLIASAKTFGMIQGWGAYSLTETAIRYFYPTHEQDKRLAELEFFRTPSAFAVLIKTFDGNILPATKVMSHVLLKNTSVPRSWVERAAAIFNETARQLGIVDENGRLRFTVAIENAGMEDKDQLPQAVIAGKIDTPAAPVLPLLSPSAVLPQIQQPTGRPSSTEWHHSEAGGTVRVETPMPLPRALWERLKRYVEILEPPSEGERT